MSAIKVGDRVRLGAGSGSYEVVLAVTTTHAFIVWAETPASYVQRVPLSELTLVEAAPAKEPSPSLVEEALKQRESLLAENARLRAALQTAVNCEFTGSPGAGPCTDWVEAAAALGIRPKETP